MQRALIQPMSRETAVSAEAGASPVSWRLLDRGIFGFLLALMPVVAIPYGTVEPWSESLFECGIFFLTALWLVEGWLSGSWRVKGGSYLAPMIALAAFAYLQSLPIWRGTSMSVDSFTTGRVASRLLALTFTCALLLRFTSSRARLRALILTAIGTASGSAIFGLLRQTVQGDAHEFLLPHLHAGLGYAQFINRNHFAFLMELGLGLGMSLIITGFFGRRRNPEREEERGTVMIAGALLVPMVMALALCNSRGGFFALLSQLFFLPLLLTLWAPVDQELHHEPRTTGTRAMQATLACLLAIVIIGGVLWTGGDSLLGRLHTTASELRREDISVAEGVSRVEVWRASWALGKANWATGVGLGAYSTAIPPYHRSSGELELHEAHNDYLELLAGAGIIGVGLLAWFLIAFVLSARRRILESDDRFYRSARLGALTGLFGVAIHSLFDFGLHVTIISLIAVALVAIATAHDPGAGPVEKHAFRE